MNGFGSSEMKTAVDPELAVGHLVFKVADLKRSCQFYSNLGLPPCDIDEELAIIELRGGTHLVLLSIDPQAAEDIAESLTGQFHKKFSEQFDLMIKGKGLNELKKYRSELISRGIAAGEIPDETFFGHHLFLHKGPRRERHNDLHQPRILVKGRGFWPTAVHVSARNYERHSQAYI